MEQATFDDFMKLDIRVGTIVEARPFEKARRPAYQLLVDLGPELGRKRRDTDRWGRSYGLHGVLYRKPSGPYTVPCAYPV